MDLVDNMSKNSDEGNYSRLPIGIFLDLSNAFDTIDHTILLDKLCRYGIRGVTLNWLKHYLNDRKQFVSYNNTTSISMKVTCGVPKDPYWDHYCSFVHKRYRKRIEYI